MAYEFAYLVYACSSKWININLIINSDLIFDNFWDKPIKSWILFEFPLKVSSLIVSQMNFQVMFLQLVEISSPSIFKELEKRSVQVHLV